MAIDDKSFHDRMCEKYGISHLPKDWEYRKAKTGNKKPVEGVGINDVEFACQPIINGKRIRLKAYSCWVDLLKRAFNAAEKERYPTYLNTTVSEDWVVFSNFLSWFNKNYSAGMVLDKDLILRGNKIYSQDTCLFIPAEINGFLAVTNKSTLPVGVSTNGNKFGSRIRKENELKFLGNFNTPESAHMAWQLAKIEHAKELMNKYSLPQLQLVIDRLQNDYDNGLITEVI